jgi:hypothetical protein
MKKYVLATALMALSAVSLNSMESQEGPAGTSHCVCYLITSPCDCIDCLVKRFKQSGILDERCVDCIEKILSSKTVALRTTLVKALLPIVRERVAKFAPKAANHDFGFNDEVLTLALLEAHAIELGVSLETVETTEEAAAAPRED